MQQFFQYYNRVQRFGGGFTSLPGWGRVLVGIFALPGIVLAVLSLILFMISILALLLLTMPVYRLITAISGSGAENNLNSAGGVFDPPSGRKQVDVRVVE